VPQFVTGVKLRFLKISTAVGLLLSASSASAEWLHVGSTSAGSRYFMDFERIEKVGGRMHAWVKIDARQDASVKYRESKVLYSAICSDKKLKMISYTDYDSYGKIVSSRSFTDSVYSDYDYKYVTPESIGETIMNVTCAMQSKGE
jgi:hypothetical protein